MVKVLNILYFDPGTGKWGRVKPQRSPPPPSQSTMSVAVLQFNANDSPSDDVAAARAKTLNDALRQRAPAVISLIGVPDSVLKAVMALDWVRASYAATEGTPNGAVMLWHCGLPVPLAESSDRPQCTMINLRKFHGADGVIIAAHTAEDASTDARATEALQLVGKASPDGTTILLFNPYNAPASQTSAPSTDLTDMLGKVRASSGFVEDLTSPPGGPTVWLKGSNLLTTGIAIVPCGDLCKTCIVATMVPRGPIPAAQQASPPPRSSAASDDMTPTPASMGSGLPEGVFPSAPAGDASRKRVWSSKHSSAIRVRDGTDEVHYDLTTAFPKSDDAIKALNNGAFSWNSDYCILHGRLLAVHGQNADIPSFRQYMTSHPPPTRPNLAGVAGAVAGNAPREVDKTRRGKETNNFSPYCLLTPTLSSTRRRVWSPHRAVLLFQVTPREMKFDITELVGVSANALNAAVERLNGQRSKAGKVEESAESKEQEGGPHDVEEDLLNGYRFDYALLYSADRHGYWLLAAIDVPCDIAPCRVAARALPGPVVSMLQQEAGLA